MTRDLRLLPISALELEARRLEARSDVVLRQRSLGALDASRGRPPTRPESILLRERCWQLGFDSGWQGALGALRKHGGVVPRPGPDEPAADFEAAPAAVRASRAGLGEARASELLAAALDLLEQVVEAPAPSVPGSCHRMLRLRESTLLEIGGFLDGFRPAPDAVAS